MSKQVEYVISKGNFDFFLTQLPKTQSIWPKWLETLWAELEELRAFKDSVEANTPREIAKESMTEIANESAIQQLAIELAETRKRLDGLNFTITEEAIFNSKMREKLGKELRKELFSKIDEVFTVANKERNARVEDDRNLHERIKKFEHQAGKSADVSINNVTSQEQARMGGIWKPSFDSTPSIHGRFNCGGKYILPKTSLIINRPPIEIKPGFKFRVDRNKDTKVYVLVERYNDDGLEYWKCGDTRHREVDVIAYFTSGTWVPA